MSHLIKSMVGLGFCCVLLTGCGGGGSSDNSDPEVQSPTQPEIVATFELGSFTAQYYFEDDGTFPGSGNDGSDPDIIPVLVSQETTDRIAINYAFDDLDGINANNFYGVWEGSIEVLEASTIDINFDYSNSDLDFNIDGAVSQEWINGNKTLRVTVNEGSHSIQAKFHNHWQVASLNVTFTQHTIIATSSEAASALAPKIAGNTKILYVGASESSDFFNELTIELPDYSGNILLFVSSYQSLNIIIDNPFATTISAVVVNSYNPISSVTGHDAPVYHVKDLDYGYSDFTGPRGDINVMTGRNPDYETGGYSIESVVIPPL